MFQEEQARLRKLEEAAALEEKHRKQNETRQMFEKSVRMKREREARNMQEQLAFDMKILEQLLEETHNEAMEAQQRKVSYFGLIFSGPCAGFKSQRAIFPYPFHLMQLGGYIGKKCASRGKLFLALRSPKYSRK